MTLTSSPDYGLPRDSCCLAAAPRTAVAAVCQRPQPQLPPPNTQSHIQSSNATSHQTVDVSWTDIAGTRAAGTGGPAAMVTGLVARPLPWLVW